MSRSEDDLRAFYADQPADPAAEQRLADLVTGARPVSRRRIAQHWMVATAAAAAVLVAASLSVVGAWARHQATGRATHPAVAGQPSFTRAPDASALVPITPQVVVHTLMLGPLPPGGRTSQLDGAVHPGWVSGRLRYDSLAGSAVLRVDVCDTSRSRRCPSVPGGPTLTTRVNGFLVVANGDTATGVTVPASPPPGSGSFASARQVLFVLARRGDVQVIVSESGVGGPDDALLPLTPDDLVAIATSDRWRSRVPAAVASSAASLFVPDDTSDRSTRAPVTPWGGLSGPTSLPSPGDRTVTGTPG